MRPPSQKTDHTNFDLRTQIHSIIGFAELASVEPNAEQQQICLKSIIEIAMSLLVVLGDIPDNSPQSRSSLPLPRLTASANTHAKSHHLALGSRILLVEDNHTNQMLALRLLLKHGYEVTVVNHGKEALARLREEAFDLVLMDLQMPVMDGITALQFIREFNSIPNDPDFAQTPPDVPVVALTADIVTEEGEAFETLGFDAAFVKPFESARLFPLIDSLLLSRIQSQVN